MQAVLIVSPPTMAWLDMNALEALKTSDMQEYKRNMTKVFFYWPNHNHTNHSTLLRSYLHQNLTSNTQVAVLLGALEKEADREMEEVTEFMLKLGKLCNRYIFFYSQISDEAEEVAFDKSEMETVEEMGKGYPEVGQHCTD